jgi:hypothetical protein
VKTFQFNKRSFAFFAVALAFIIGTSSGVEFVYYSILKFSTMQLGDAGTIFAEILVGFTGLQTSLFSKKRISHIPPATQAQPFLTRDTAILLVYTIFFYFGIYLTVISLACLVSTSLGFWLEHA